jgi:hypothetical protein
VDVEVLLAFHCLVYIVDFILGVKDYTFLLYCHFVYPSTLYQVDIFKSYIQLLERCHPEIRMKWQMSTGPKVEHLVFDVELAYAYA